MCVHVLLLGPITADMLVGGGGAGGGAAETRGRDYCRLLVRCVGGSVRVSCCVQTCALKRS